MASRAAFASGRAAATSSQPSTTVSAFETSCSAPARSASRSEPLGGGTLTGAPERFTRKPYYARRMIASSFPFLTEFQWRRIPQQVALHARRTPGSDERGFSVWYRIQRGWNQKLERAEFVAPRLGYL